MMDFMDRDDARAVLREKLRQNFDGKIVRKDLKRGKGSFCIMAFLGNINQSAEDTVYKALGAGEMLDM